MNLKEIAVEYLKNNGFDGLYNEFIGCGCENDDLMPCDGPRDDCVPGHKIPCNPETCTAYGKCPWHIGQKEQS